MKLEKYFFDSEFYRESVFSSSKRAAAGRVAVVVKKPAVRSPFFPDLFV